jgi:hypothetical protein
MTLQDQYTLIKEGKGNKEIFLKQAKSLFPQYVTNASTFQETTSILKQRGIISEAAGGIVTTGTTPDWVSIFKENIAEAANEAKAIEKKTTKNVTDAETRNYDYEDEKNIDNVSFNQYLLGLSVEIDNPKNVDKTIEELKAIVTKNLTKDNQYYLKNGQFGIEGLGYTDKLPGYSPSKEVKGKYKASGMEPVKLKESIPGRSPQIGSNEWEYQFKTWKEKLYDIIMNDANLDIDDIAVDDLELQRYFNANKSPEQVYNDVWLKDAGNFRNTGLFEESDGEDEGVNESKLRKIISALIREAIDIKSIEDTGKKASDNAKSKLIDKEIAKRKKKLKALTTLKELEEDSVNPKKIKELNDDIKKLEKLKSKLGESKKSSELKNTQVLDEESLEEATVAANPATSTKLSAAYKKKQAALVKLAAAETEVGKADSEIQNIEKT